MQIKIPVIGRVDISFHGRNNVSDKIRLARASACIRHQRPYDYDEKHGLFVMRDVGEPETVWNVKTNAGIDFLHQQGYATSGLGSNGLNYIALSNDTVTETATSTVLSNEIAANGLSRAQGAYAHTASTTTTTIDKTFTATGAQSAQKAALFTASSAGTMCHVLGFTQRSLITNDTIQITFTITLS